MRLRHSLIALLLGVSLAIGGCASQPAAEETNKSENTGTKEAADYEQTKLGMIQPSAYNNTAGLTLEPGSYFSLIGRGGDAAYWNEVKAGAERAVKDLNETLGYKKDEKIKIVFSAPDMENDIDGQVNLLDEELARYPSAIGIAMVDSDACAVQFDLAAENNIPIVAFDAGTDYQNIVSLVKTNDVDAATMAAHKLSDLIGDEGEIVLVVHDSVSMTAKERESAFVAAITNEHPNVKIADIYHLDKLEERKEQLSVEENEETEITQEEILANILETHPNVKGIFATSESAADVTAETLAGMEDAKIQVVSFDGGETQIKRLEEGTFSGLIVQNPFGIGYATVVASARAVLGQGNEAVVDTGYTWVTVDNLKDEAIQSMLY